LRFHAEISMNGIQRISLAEFSRLYLSSLGAAPGPNDTTGPVASIQVFENSYAVQVVLGMSRMSSEVRPVRLIG
jgi:hypothetical protein